MQVELTRHAEIASPAQMMCAFWALSHMQLSDATIIIFTNPIFTALAAAVFLGERFGVHQGAAALLCFVGVILVARPAFIFGDSVEHGASPADSSDTATLGGAAFTASRWFAIVAALLSAIIASFAYLSIRKLKGVNTMVVVAVYGAFGFVLSLVMLFSLQSWTPPTSVAQWCMLLGIGVLGFLAQWLLNGGMQREQAGIGSLMRNIDVACAFLWQATILQQDVSLWAVGGALLVLGGAGWVMWQKARGAPAKHSTPPTAPEEEGGEGAAAARMPNVPHTPLKNSDEHEAEHGASSRTHAPSALLTFGSGQNGAKSSPPSGGHVSMKHAVFEIGPASDSEEEV